MQFFKKVRFLKGAGSFLIVSDSELWRQTKVGPLQGAACKVFVSLASRISFGMNVKSMG